MVGYKIYQKEILLPYSTYLAYCHMMSHHFLMIGAWPIAMGVSMFIQQKLNPAPTDPMQAKIFMFFPLFLTVILAPFPAGLVIYWTVNNILTMAQQVFIMKRTTVKTTT